MKVSYSDVLMMPTAERRFYLGLLLKNKHEEEEKREEGKGDVTTSKGTRKTKVGGKALKNKLKSGEIPLK